MAKEQDDKKHYFDSSYGVYVTKIYSGDCCITDRANEMMVTILGSCIAACIRDVKIKVGGMNHFLLPNTKDINNASTRYGAYAMEELINAILKKGGRKEDLEIKLFGGANVIESTARIGDRNCEFVRNYLLKEGLLCSSKDLGGNYPRRVHYYPATGKVMLRAIEAKNELSKVKAEEERLYKHTLDIKSQHNEIGGDVELF